MNLMFFLCFKSNLGIMTLASKLHLTLEKLTQNIDFEVQYNLGKKKYFILLVIKEIFYVI